MLPLQDVRKVSEVITFQIPDTDNQDQNEGGGEKTQSNSESQSVNK